MKERLTKRLGELQAEFAAGQKMLAELDAKQKTLRETLLRISGAIQVLEEELAHTASPGCNSAAPAAQAEVTCLLPEDA